MVICCLFSVDDLEVTLNVLMTSPSRRNPTSDRLAGRVTEHRNANVLLMMAKPGVKQLIEGPGTSDDVVSTSRDVDVMEVNDDVVLSVTAVLLSGEVAPLVVAELVVDDALRENNSVHQFICSKKLIHINTEPLKN